MSVAILGNPAPLYDVHLGGPFPQQTAFATVNGGWDTGFLCPIPYPPLEDTGGVIPRDIWSFGAENTGIVSERGFRNGLNAIGRKSTGVGRRVDGMGGITLLPSLDQTGLAPGYANPSWKRVHWLRFNMSMEIGTLDERSGLLLAGMAGPQTADQWTATLTDATMIWLGGFGVVGDGAGNWNWESYDPVSTPAPTPPWSAGVIESVSLAAAIPDPTDWTTFDHVIISAAGGRDAEYQLWIDDALFLTRDWVNAPALPPLGPVAGSAETYRYSPIARIGTPSDEFMFWGDWEYRMGRFTKTGQELFK